MNLEKALSVDGWMSAPELEWLAEQASKHHLIVEVGSWMGRTTRALADNSTGAVLAVDTWEGSADQKEMLAGKPCDYLYKTFYHNLIDHIASGRVQPVRCPSVEAARQFAEAGMKFDMVFIDAAHDYDSVVADIEAWRPLVMKGGLLCGHDYDWGYPGVVHAVSQLIDPVPNQAANGSSIWYKFLVDPA